MNTFLPQPTQEEVEARYEAGREQRIKNQRIEIAKSNACLAWAMSLNFSEHQNRFETIANLGSDVEQAVALHLANYCNKQADHYRAEHKHYTAEVDG